MTIPRGKLFALTAVVLAAAVVTATGAFTSVTAQRTADVDVANDANAYLGLEPHQTSPNGAGAYASAQNGELTIQLNDQAGVAGSGVNPNATTQIDSVFNITNQGTQDVGVWLEENASAVTFSAGGSVLENAGNATTLSPGETVQVDITVDTTGVSAGTDLLDDVTIHANASAA